MRPASRPIGGALLYLATEVDREIEVDFNHWSEGHLKDNLALSGFLAARRLRKCPASPEASSAPTYLTLYDLTEPEAIEALESPSRDRSMPSAFDGRFRFSRSLFRALDSAADRPIRQLRGPAVLHVTADVEPAYNREFLEWYVGEHVPAVRSAPGVLSVRRFENAYLDSKGNPSTSGFRYLTLYEMEEPGVVDRPATIEAARIASSPGRLEGHHRFTHRTYEEFVTLEA